MYDSKLKQLDDVIKKTLKSIDESKEEISDISSFAKNEYEELEEEFLKLKVEAHDIINHVDLLEDKLKKSKFELLKINKNFDDYTEEDMQTVYEETDSLRLKLAEERQREQYLIKRRHDLELHFKNVRLISEKADKLFNNFRFAYSAINGDLSQIGNEVKDIDDIKNWGMKAIQIQEMERKRIARDMHDGPTQSLTNLIYKTEICIKLLDKDIDQTKIELQTLRNLIRNTIDETRRLIYNLRPMSIDDLGFIPTLERLIENTSDENNIKIILNAQNLMDKQLDPTYTLTLYRVTQEALNNIIKHSQAELVEICVNINNHFIEVIITDNGVGFDLSEIKSRNDNTGLGLTMMRERISFLEGNVKIHSEINVGTVIKVEIPIDEKELTISHEEN